MTLARQVFNQWIVRQLLILIFIIIAAVFIHVLSLRGILPFIEFVSKTSVC